MIRDKFLVSLSSGGESRAGIRRAAAEKYRLASFLSKSPNRYRKRAPRECGQTVGHSGAREGVRMRGREDRGLAMPAADPAAEAGATGPAAASRARGLREGTPAGQRHRRGLFGRLEVGFLRGRDRSGVTAGGGSAAGCPATSAGTGRAGSRRSAGAAGPCTTPSGAAGGGSGRPPRPVQENVRIPLAARYGLILGGRTARVGVSASPHGFGI